MNVYITTIHRNKILYNKPFSNETLAFTALIKQLVRIASQEYQNYCFRALTCVCDKSSQDYNEHKDWFVTGMDETINILGWEDTVPPNQMRELQQTYTLKDVHHNENDIKIILDNYIVSFYSSDSGYTWEITNNILDHE